MNSKQKSQTATRLQATALAAALFCAPDVRSLAAEPVPALATNVPAPEWLTQPMALVDAVNIALRQNARILKGKQDLEATAGIVVQTKAIAMPRLRGTAGYAHDELVETPSFSNSASIFPTIEDRWNGGIRLSQTIYEGGRIRSALRSARYTEEQALLQYQAVVADTLLEVRTAYYNVLMAEQEIVVQRASTNLLFKELEDTTRRFEAGTVPRFNVLRAEVELANARPKLFRAENAFRISKSDLVNSLGYDLPASVVEDIPLQLTGKLAAEPYEIALPAAIARALEYRPELGALRLSEKLRKEDVTQAKSRYFPTLEVFGGYGARSPNFQEDFFGSVAGASAGVQMNWEMWDGNYTKGRVMQTKALVEKARIETQDAARKIELEVRTGYSFFLEAKQVLASQEKVLEQADEALRLANARYDAGTGTQLDVLNAQTSLTDARTTHVRALREYMVALARLQRAVGWDVPRSSPDKSNAEKPAGAAGAKETKGTAPGEAK